MTTEQDELYRKTLVPLDRDTYIVRTQAALRTLIKEMKKRYEMGSEDTVRFEGNFIYPCVVVVRSRYARGRFELILSILHLKAHLRVLSERISKIYRNDPDMAKDFPWIAAVKKQG